MENKTDLRFKFVELLFALAIGQVGIELGDIFTKVNNPLNFPYLFSHLFLVTIIIVCSWIGWQNATALGNTKHIYAIFSHQFIILLLDVFLVICYFILARQVELEKDGQPRMAETYKETLWTMIILATYLLWDFVTNIFNENLHAVNNAYKRTIKIDFRVFLKNSRITILCLFISIFIFEFMGNTNSQSKKVIVDLTLAALFFLFRRWNQEIKKEYTIDKEHFKYIKDFEPTTDKVNIIESNFIFITKWTASKLLPAILLISGIWLYFHCNC